MAKFRFRRILPAKSIYCQDRADLASFIALVLEVASPPWTRGEIVLAADLAAAHGWKELRPAHPDVAELSRVLRSSELHPGAAEDVTFRGVNSVSRKLTDICTLHPDYLGKATRGNRLDRPVLDEFLEDPLRMHREASEIRLLLSTGGAWSDPDERESVLEGRLLIARHQRRERSPKLRALKLAQVARLGRPIACEVCAFDFKEAYGVRGDGYIEVHHTTPLHISGEVVTAMDDLALLCSNCHRMIHRSPWVSPAELSAIRAGVTAV